MRWGLAEAPAPRTLELARHVLVKLHPHADSSACRMIAFAASACSRLTVGY